MRSNAAFYTFIAAVTIVITTSIFTLNIFAAKSKSPSLDLPSIRPIKPTPALTIDIAIPIHHKKRHLAVNNNAGQPGHIFHVVLTNNSKKPINLWREWCSWGYFNLSFEAIDDNGITHIIKRHPRPWRKNYPDNLTLEPREHRVIPVSLIPARPKQESGLWSLETLTQAKPKTVSLRPIFHIPPDRFSKQNKVWTGKISGKLKTYNITYH